VAMEHDKGLWLVRDRDVALTITPQSNGTCAVCRSKLSKDMPMIPNISMDNIVDRYIQSFGASGNEDWMPGGTKHVDWNFRKE